MLAELSSRASRRSSVRFNQAGVACSRAAQSRSFLFAQPLLHTALTRLLDMASEAAEASEPAGLASTGAAEAPEPAGPASSAVGDTEGTDAKAGGGSWPRVHALNMLRLVFEERALATDTLPFLAQGAASGASRRELSSMGRCSCGQNPYSRAQLGDLRRGASGVDHAAVKIRRTAGGL